MGSGGGNIAQQVSSTVNRPIGSFLGNIGVSDPSTRGGLSGLISGGTSGVVGGGFLGGSLGLGPGAIIGAGVGGTVGGVTGFLQGQKVGQRIEDAREQANTAEFARQDFNEDIFSLAEGIAGRVAQNPDFDFDSLSFQGGDARTERLRNLVSLFQRRSLEIQQGTFEPGISQTRLALVE